MTNDITTLEQLLTDESFLAAYDGRNGSHKKEWQEWSEWSEADPARAALIGQAIRLLTVIRLAEAPIPAYQTELSTRYLLQRINPREEERTSPTRPRYLLRNYLTVAFRNLSRETGFASINILGLALGLAVCLLITLYVMDERSYDRFNENADRIFRLKSDIAYNGNREEGTATPASMGPLLVKDFPQIQQYTRIGAMYAALVLKGQVTTMEPGFIMTDSTIFDVFTLPFITGNPRTALTNPNDIVISKDVALKYFGTVDCLGKTLHVNNERDYTITGVMKDMPEQSHFHARFITSVLQNPENTSTNLLNNSVITYVLVRPGTTRANLDHCLDEFTRTHIMAAINNFLHGKMGHLFENPENHYLFYSEVLTSIHFDPQEQKYIYIFTTIAVLILLMACVNFMNLSTARSAHRAKEVGIRKVLGSLRKELIAQFLVESLLTSILAMLIAIGITIGLLPYLNLLSGKHITVGFLANSWLLPWLTATILVVGMLAGLYPAFYLSAFRPVQVLKGRLIANFRSGWLRNVLVVFQFTIAILLIVGTGIIYRQLNYIRHKDLGYNREQVLVVRNIGSLWIHADRFKQDVLQLPGVLGATMTYFLPNESGMGSDTFFKDSSMTSSNAVILTLWPIDANYIPTLGMTITAGRNFSPNLATDSSAILINETAQHLMGFDDPIGKTIWQPMDAVRWPGQAFAAHIVGVIKDFQPGSLHNKIPPMIFRRQEVRGSLAIRVKTTDMPGLIAKIEKAYYSWDKMRGQPFPWDFMDDTFNRLYQDDQRTGVLFVTFAGLAILIGCLGLFGLVTYAAEQRTREIGIRKVLGASPGSIVRLLSKEFIILTAVSAGIAFPLGAWAMQSWLDGFAYRTEMSWWIFAAAGTLAIGITLITVSFRAIDAARSDPAKTLRHAP